MRLYINFININIFCSMGGPPTSLKPELLFQMWKRDLRNQPCMCYCYLNQTVLITRCMIVQSTQLTSLQRFVDGLLVFECALLRHVLTSNFKYVWDVCQKYVACRLDVC